MKREIKFRGKRIDNGEWVYGNYQAGIGKEPHVISWWTLEQHEGDAWYETDVAIVDPETVGQYAGLTDRKGAEIYEGDILTAEHYPFQDEGKYNYHGVIEWIDEEASFYMTKRLANKEKRGISDGISQPIESIEEFEVIGNRWSNPDLLEGEKI